MNSELYRINGRDLGRGALNAIFISIIVALGGVVTQTGFNVFDANFAQIGANLVNVGVISFITYITAMFTQDKEGKILGRY